MLIVKEFLTILLTKKNTCILLLVNLSYVRTQYGTKIFEFSKTTVRKYYSLYHRDLL